MKKQKGITLIALTITIVVMMIIAGITTYFGNDLIREVNLQDLRTNMLLIQAKAKECVEEVRFQTANVTDESVKNQIKAENYKGNPITDNEEVKNLAEGTGQITGEIGEYYYLTEQNLKDMGIENLSADEYGYFIVRYNITDIKVEVINTKGYQGNYTLEQINALLEEQ